jgi:hypothetical protein
VGKDCQSGSKGRLVRLVLIYWLRVGLISVCLLLELRAEESMSNA